MVRDAMIPTYGRVCIIIGLVIGSYSLWPDEGWDFKLTERVKCEEIRKVYTNNGKFYTNGDSPVVKCERL